VSGFGELQDGMTGREPAGPKREGYRRRSRGYAHVSLTGVTACIASQLTSPGWAIRGDVRTRRCGAKKTGCSNCLYRFGRLLWFWSAVSLA